MKYLNIAHKYRCSIQCHILLDVGLLGVYKHQGIIDRHHWCMLSSCAQLIQMDPLILQVRNGSLCMVFWTINLKARKVDGGLLKNVKQHSGLEDPSHLVVDLFPTTQEFIL